LFWRALRLLRQLRAAERTHFAVRSKAACLNLSATIFQPSAPSAISCSVISLPAYSIFSSRRAYDGIRAWRVLAGDGRRGKAERAVFSDCTHIFFATATLCCVSARCHSALFLSAFENRTPSRWLSWRDAYWRVKFGWQQLLQQHCLFGRWRVSTSSLTLATYKPDAAGDMPPALPCCLSAAALSKPPELPGADGG